MRIAKLLARVCSESVSGLCAIAIGSATSYCPAIALSIAIPMVVGKLSTLWLRVCIAQELHAQEALEVSRSSLSLATQGVLCSVDKFRVELKSGAIVTPMGELCWLVFDCLLQPSNMMQSVAP
jgi:hypothetical protein